MESLGSVPESLSVDQIKGHLAAYRGKLSSSALNSRVCGIKYYFRKVVRRPDLVVDVPNPRVAKYVQEVLSEGDLTILYAACQNMRELSLLHLLFDTGMRSREVSTLKLTDFNKTYSQVTIRSSKGGNLLRLQQLMGHENIESTLHYLKYCTIPLIDCATPLSVMLNRHKNTKPKS